MTTARIRYTYLTHRATGETFGARLYGNKIEALTVPLSPDAMDGPADDQADYLPLDPAHRLSDYVEG